MQSATVVHTANNYFFINGYAALLGLASSTIAKSTSSSQVSSKAKSGQGKVQSNVLKSILGDALDEPSKEDDDLAFAS